MSQEKTFTIVQAYHSDGCPTKFEGKSGSGRFVSETPSASAKKAMSSLCQRKKIRGRCSLYVVIRETTRGSKHKEHAYLARRHVKETPSPFGHKYDIHTKKLTMEELSKKCKKSYKTSGRMKARTSKMLTKRKFNPPGQQ
jgi:hypothetical protein